MKTNIFYAAIIGLSIFWLNGYFLGLTDTGRDIYPYYERLSIDYVIPSPGYGQKEELEKEPFIETATPYYFTRLPIIHNGEKTDVSLHIIEKDADINKTPFSQKLLISGELPKENEIIIDYRAAKEANARIGDKAEIILGTAAFSYQISGIAATNDLISRQRPPAALIYCTSVVRQALEEMSGHMLSYQWAYVKASDAIAARDYFKKSYTPKGEYGERKWYKSEADYENKKKSIESSDISNEITDVSDLRASASAADKEKAAHNRKNIIKAIAFSALAYILAWMLLLKIKEKGYRKKINNGKSVILVMLEFDFAQLLCFALCSCLTLLFYYDEFTKYSVYLAAVNFVSFAIVLLKTFASVAKTDVSK